MVIKDHLISKCPFGVFKSPKKPTKFISAIYQKKLLPCQNRNFDRFALELNIAI